MKPVPDAAVLRNLIRKHKGNLSAVAREYRDSDGNTYTRQALSLRMGDKLLGYAATQRAKHGVFGPRKNLPEGAIDLVAERARIVDVTARAATYHAAARKLDISRMQLHRKMKLHKITAREILAHRDSIRTA